MEASRFVRRRGPNLLTDGGEVFFCSSLKFIRSVCVCVLDFMAVLQILQIQLKIFLVVFKEQKFRSLTFKIEGTLCKG
jgi:hypothetical protein